MGSDRVTQPVQGVAQRRAPGLIPAGVRAGVAAAITPPAIDTVSAAPGTFFNDVDLVGRRVLFQKLAVIGQSGQLPAVNLFQGVSERHVAKAVMMTVAFAVGGDVHELRPLALRRESAGQSLDEAVAVGE